MVSSNFSLLGETLDAVSAAKEKLEVKSKWFEKEIPKKEVSLQYETQVV